MVKPLPTSASSRRRMRTPSLIIGSLSAATACANLFGVGELKGGVDAEPLAGSSGVSAAQGGLSATPAAGGAVTGGGGRVTSGGRATTGGSALSDAGGGAAAGEDVGGAAGAGAVPAGAGGASPGGRENSGGEASMSAGEGGDSGAGGGSEIDDTPASCRDAALLCGTPALSRSCCASFAIESGTFYRSYDKVPNEGFDMPLAPASIQSFRLDAYEVTVGRFRRFLAAYPWRPKAGDGRNPANPADSGWNDAWSALLPPDAAALSAALRGCGSADAAPLSTLTAAPDENEALPINCLTWFEAFAFCIWDGGRLPSEAEWNYAAAAGDQARVYPWASSSPADIDASRAVYGLAIMAPVGSKPAGDGAFGQADLAGNVWEWTVDSFRDPYPLPCDDCAELSAEADSLRVLRGGAYYNQPFFLRSAGRGNALPSTRDPGYGARCARAK